MSPAPALQRGFGFCSQNARIVYTVLLDNGYQPSIMVHEQHTLIEVNDTVIDADYGVFIPHSLDVLHDRPYLASFFYVNFPKELPGLTKIFKDGFDQFSDRETLVGLLTFERQTQYLKWQIPIGGLLLAIVFGAIGRRLMWSADRVRHKFAAPRSELQAAE